MRLQKGWPHDPANWHHYDPEHNKQIMTMVYTPDNTVPHLAINLETEANGKPKDCYLWRRNTGVTLVT
jgi:hypothetical protein